MGRRLLPALRFIGRHAKLATGERGEGIAVRLWQRETSGTAAKTPICSRRCGTAFRALRCPLFLCPPTASGVSFLIFGVSVATAEQRMRSYRAMSRRGETKYGVRGERG